MENKGIVQVYCGPGKGKTSVAIGQAIRAIGHGKTAIVIQFLKGRATSEVDYLSVLEPNVKLFRFEKKNKCYEDLTEEERQVNVTAVTTRAAVDNDDFVVRTVLGTLTVESDCYCHINYK